MKDVKFSDAKNSLVKLWGILGSVIFVFFVIQLEGTRYDGIYQQAVGWFLPNLLPYSFNYGYRIL
jgi:hypothetical protein